MTTPMMTDKQRDYIISLATLAGYGDNWEHAIADACGVTPYALLSTGITIKDASKAINWLKDRAVDSGSEDADRIIRG